MPTSVHKNEHCNKKAKSGLEITLNTEVSGLKTLWKRKL
jgi:hypothetical protein